MTNAPNRERSHFNKEEGEILLDYAAACIEAALKKERLPFFQNKLASAPVVGVFVSLKRGSLLRACCGSLNETAPAPLGELLEAAANRTALHDERFPGISLGELNQLDLEVSVMHDLRVMSTNPNLRINDLTIGKHGLIMTHNKSRGLLLPQVAAENSWDALTFLQQICRKANLPTDTWLHPEAVLKKFSATIFHRTPRIRDIDFRELSEEVTSAVVEYATALVEKGAEGAGQIPERLKIPVSPTGWGMLIQTSGRRTEAAFRDKGTLGDLVFETAKKLHLEGKSEANKIQDFLAFSHPILLDPSDFPRRFGSIQPGSAVTARKGDRTSVVLKQGHTDPVGQVLSQMGQTPNTWGSSGVELQSHLVLNLSQPDAMAKAPPLQGMVNGVRLPAMAGKFYPDSEVQMKAELDRLFASCKAEEKSKVRAVMLPHAGWKFCGDIIAETLSRIKIPDIVVIVGPKHTPLGSRWSVSNAKRWRIPGAEVPVDEESTAYLAATIKGLEKEELAHIREHGTEVLVPFLHYLNPNVRIVPIAVGSGTHEDFVTFGKSLKRFRDRLKADGDECLFVISSDMNHFADDKVNRALDKLALDVLQTGDTERLFEVCIQNHISMCGMRPAVAVLSSLGLDVQKHCPDIELVRYETSARVTMDPTRVVGYAGLLVG